MGNESARLLAQLLGDDASLNTLIAAVEAGTADDAAIDAWVSANRDRVIGQLLGRWPPVPALRSAIPRLPPLDGWTPRVELGIAKLGVDSPAATLGGTARRHVLALLPPESASIELGAGPITGGGQVTVRDASHASGSLGLRLGAIDVNGLALLETSGDTMSLVVVIGIRFLPPIQLSFGFALSAVGGVVGIHRRIDADALRARLADGSAVDALFPANPVDGAARLLAALAAIFVPADGSHVVGPTFSLTWLDLGAHSLVRMDVAVLIQLPDGRVAIVGRAALDLGPLLALRMDVFGLIDPSRKLVAVDAVLVDSRALGLFRVTGSAVFRSSAGDPPYVLAAMGGFYPGFHPEPADIPPQQRLGLALDIPCPLSIRANGYLAITPNTFQVGADLEVAIDLSVIAARGFLRFDAIVQFDPFHLHADYAAGWEVRVAIFEGGTTVSGWIDGPGPWTVHARVSISLLIDDFSWSDTFRFGQPGPPADPPIARVADVLAETFSSPANLKADEAADRHVAIRPRPGGIPPGWTLCSPMAALTWSQGVVPLDLPVTRAGGRRLASEQTARLSFGPAAVSAGGDAVDWFAPGTYLELTQAEALTLPPFQLLKAGGRLRLAPERGSGSIASTAHETYVRRGAVPTASEDVADPALHLAVLLPLRALQAAAGVTAAAAVGTRSPLVTVRQETWVHHRDGESRTTESATHAVLAARAGGIALAAADRPIPVGLI